MKRLKHLFSLCLIMTSLIVASSCLQKTVSNKKSDSDNDSTGYSNNGNNNDDGGDRGSENDYDGGGNNGGGGSGDGGDPNDPGVPDAGQDLEYYTISNIVVKTPKSGTTFWSSTNNMNSADQHIFSTDSRFNLRVVPRRGPSEGVQAADGTTCTNDSTLKYDNLSIDVCVRKKSGSCFNTTSFHNVSVGNASKVKEFNPPASSEPLVVEVKSVEWDYWCKSGAWGDEYCPTGPINFGTGSMANDVRDCAKFDIQFSTDQTKDLPGDRL